MGEKFLIDTCTVVKYLSDSLPTGVVPFMDALVDSDSKVSFITKIELLVWKDASEDETIVRQEFLKGSEILYIDDKIINETIRIRKTTRIKLPDAVIAATAICNGYTLLSTNDNDFNKVIPLGLSYRNPERDFSEE